MSVSPFSMTATRTTLASVFGVDFDDFHAEGLRFVGQKLFELVEGPSVQVGALFLSKFTSFPDASEVFNRNRWVPGRVGEFHDAPANDMIFVSLKTLLSTRQPFQGSPRTVATRRCLFLLERCADFGVAIADMIGVPTAEEGLGLTICNGSNNIDAAIYADYGIIGFGNSCDFPFKGYG